MKNYIINTSNLQKGGSMQVAYSFIEECCKLHEINFHLFLGSASKEIYLNNYFSEKKNIKIYIIDFHPSKSIYSFFMYFTKLCILERKIKPDGVITVFGPCYWKPKAKHIIGFANGYFLYNDSPFFINNKLNKNIFFIIKKIIHKYLLRIEADFYWTETLDAKLRLAKFLRISLKQIIVASNCANASFLNNTMINKKVFDRSKPKLLYISSYYPHKNFEFIPLVYYELLKQGYDCEFHITISNLDFQKINILNTCPGIINLGPINPSKCMHYYSTCDIVFVPSLLETFTAVYPEAMISKKPIVTSNLNFATSICADAALYYNYSSPEDAAQKIIEIINNESTRNRLVQQGLDRLSYFDTPESRFSKILQILN